VGSGSGHQGGAGRRELCHRITASAEILISWEWECEGAKNVLKLQAGSSAIGNGFRVPGFGFRVSGSGFRVQGLGFRVKDLGVRVWCV